MTVCTACGARNDERARFCSACGTGLGGPPLSPDRNDAQDEVSSDAGLRIRPTVPRRTRRSVAKLDAVTGAFSFTGRAIAARLLEEGREVVTLVRRTQPNPFGDRIRTAPIALDDPAALETALAGVDTLYNTYWIRFPRGALTWETTVARSGNLIEAARRAGVRRIVHVSVVNASLDGPTPYFAAKARVEDLVRESGLSYAIVRPTLTFGPDDILVNNLAWVLRRFPVFGVPGDARYRLQPVHVDDVAAIAVRAGQRPDDHQTDAAGPDILSFNAFVAHLRDAIRSRALLVRLPRDLAYLASRAMGLLVRDVMLTRDEVTELTSSLLVSDEPPAGQIDFASWVAANADAIGRRYHSELDRHYRGRSAM